MQTFHIDPKTKLQYLSVPGMVITIMNDKFNQYYFAQARDVLDRKSSSKKDNRVLVLSENISLSENIIAALACENIIVANTSGDTAIQRAQNYLLQNS